MLFPYLCTLLQREKACEKQLYTQTWLKSRCQQFSKVILFAYPFPMCSSPHVLDQPRNQRTKFELHQTPQMTKTIWRTWRSEQVEVEGHPRRKEFRQYWDKLMKQSFYQLFSTSRSVKQQYVSSNNIDILNNNHHLSTHAIKVSSVHKQPKKSDIK